MHLGSTNTKAQYTMADNSNRGQVLGVLIHDKLNFHNHLLPAVSKVKQILGIVNRTFETLDEELLALDIDRIDYNIFILELNIKQPEVIARNSSNLIFIRV